MDPDRLVVPGSGWRIAVGATGVGGAAVGSTTGLTGLPLAGPAAPLPWGRPLLGLVPEGLFAMVNALIRTVDVTGAGTAPGSGGMGGRRSGGQPGTTECRPA